MNDEESAFCEDRMRPMRKYRRLKFPVTFFLTVWLGAWSCTTALAGVYGNAEFRKSVDEFIQSELRMFPELATRLGDHRFDEKIDNVSAEGIAARISHANEWKIRLSGIDASRLSSQNLADLQWLLARCDNELLMSAQIRDYERSPGIYLPTPAVYSLIERNFAPLSERMRSVGAREVAALKNFDHARANLRPDRVSAVAIDIILEQMPATIAFFEKSLPEVFKSVPEGKDKRAFETANSQMIAQLKVYADWLRNDLRPRATGNYAIGATAYRRMLADADMVDIPVERLEEIGVAELTVYSRSLRKLPRKSIPKLCPRTSQRALRKIIPRRIR
jgi:uncharacterized protein (DUF885 family)